MNAKACAQRIYDKCDSGLIGRRYAVILTEDRNDVRITNPATRLLSRTLEDSPELFVGVYDINTEEAHIEADLVFAGLQ